MEVQRREHLGHVIELRTPDPAEARTMARAELDAGPELLIDGRPVRWGRLPDGSYYLDEYAYDWRDDLMDLAMSFVEYRERADERARERAREQATRR